VEAARSRLPRRRNRLVQGTIENLPFADETFDAVVATGVLEYAEIDRALVDLARVLRPGGIAVVSYPNPRAVYGIWKSRVWYPLIRGAKRLAGPPPGFPRGSRLVHPSRLQELLSASGFDLERVVATSNLVLPTPLDLLMPKTAERLGRRLENSGPRVSRRAAAQYVYAARRGRAKHGGGT
jgi:SAM-dependent methyltransferase